MNDRYSSFEDGNTWGHKRSLNEVLPVLSAQLITAPTGRPREMRNLAPADPPRPEKHHKCS